MEIMQLEPVLLQQINSHMDCPVFQNLMEGLETRVQKNESSLKEALIELA